MHSPNSMMASCSRSTRPVPLQHYSFGLWLTSILLFTAATTPTTNGCIEGERDALLDFKTGLVGGPSGRLSSWRGRVDCCRWSGVVCDNGAGHVVELNLQNSDPDSYEMPIEGSLPPIIRTLDLQFLDLSYNHINGSISSFICNCELLHIINLSDNQISGEIPWCWQEANFFVYINLANNKLSGEIPSTIGNLTGLRSLHLNNNSLQGHLPLSLKNCSGLVVLDLGDNNFSGSIPKWIAQNLQNLTVLRLCSNMFSGNIPAGLGQLHHLHVIDLANNKLSGPIPCSFGNLSAAITSWRRHLTSGGNYVLSLREINYKHSMTHPFTSATHIYVELPSPRVATILRVTM